MRVLVIGAAIGADSMEKHVLSTLESMGHDAVHFNARDFVPLRGRSARLFRALAARLLREPELLIENRLLQTAEQTRPEIVLVLLGSMLSPKTVSKLKQVVPAPLVCWCQDAMTTLGRQYLIGADYDAIFLKDHYLVQHFRSLAGLNAHYLPEACNPDIHKALTCLPSEEDAYSCDVCIYGNLYYYRQRVLEQLTDYEMKCWGNVPQWLVNRVPQMVQGRGIYEEEKAKALSVSKIVLNLMHFAEVQGINARCFEVAGCRGFQLVTYSPALEEHFEIGVELDAFRSIDELRSKIAYYLQRPHRRAEMAAASQRRAYAEHTYRCRLKDLFAKAGVG